MFFLNNIFDCRFSTLFNKGITSPKKKKEESTLEDLLKIQIENDKKYQEGVLCLLREKNTQDAIFQDKLLALLEKRNQIAENQLKPN